MKRNYPTKANEDYLEAIYVYEVENEGAPMRSTLLAQIINVSKAAVNKATNDLKEKGLIDKNAYGKILLTEEGRKVAIRTLHKHNTLMNLLLVIGVSEEIASQECCLIEHVVSDDTIEKIALFLKDINK